MGAPPPSLLFVLHVLCPLSYFNKTLLHKGLSDQAWCLVPGQTGTPVHPGSPRAPGRGRVFRTDLCSIRPSTVCLAG